MTIDNIPRTETVWFSPRGRQVLLLLFRAFSNKQIADDLGITEATVKSHVGSLLEMLNCTDRGELMLWVFQHREDAKRGATREPYLHPTDCACGEPCIAMEPAA